MSNDQHHLDSWLEPELEARVVSLVVGEASAFERSELERLMREQPELEVFRRRMTAVHELVAEALAPIGSGGKSGSGEDWRLCGDRRKAVLERIGAGQAANCVATEVHPGARVNRRRIWFQNVSAVAAVLLVAGIAALIGAAGMAIFSSSRMAAGGEWGFTGLGESASAPPAAAAAKDDFAGPAPSAEKRFAKGALAEAGSSPGYAGEGLTDEWDKPDSNRSRAAIASLGAQLGTMREEPVTPGKPVDGYEDRDGDGSADEMVRLHSRSGSAVAQDQPAATDLFGMASNASGDAGVEGAGDFFGRGRSGGAGVGQGAGQTSEETASATALNLELKPGHVEFEGFVVNAGDEATKAGEALAKDFDDIAHWSSQAEEQPQGQLGQIDPASSAVAGTGGERGQGGGGQMGGFAGFVAGGFESASEPGLQRQPGLTRFYKEGSYEWAQSGGDAVEGRGEAPTNGYARLNDGSEFGLIAGVNSIEANLTGRAGPGERPGQGEEAEELSGPVDPYFQTDLGVQAGGQGPGEESQGVSSHGKSVLSVPPGNQPAGQAAEEDARGNLPMIPEAGALARDSGSERGAEPGMATPETALPLAAETKQSLGDLPQLGQLFEAEQAIAEAMAGGVAEEKPEVGTANWRYANGREALGGDVNAATGAGAVVLDDKANLYDVPALPPVNRSDPATGPVAGPAAEAPGSSSRSGSPEGNGGAPGEGKKSLRDETITFSNTLRSPQDNFDGIRSQYEEAQGLLADSLLQFGDHDSEIAEKVTDRLVQVWSERIRELEKGLETSDLEGIASLLEQQRSDVEKARRELVELAERYQITDFDSVGLADLATSPGTRGLAAEPPLPEMTATADEPFSTFSLHVADVSFKLARAALLERGEFPPADSVRVEEFVNAFDYGDPSPSYEEKVTGRIEQAAHPFFQQQNLVRVAFRTAALGRGAQQPLRLTLLIDKSGSMEREDREATVGRALASLSEHLTPADQVTVVTFARTPRLLLEAWTGDRGAEFTDLVMRTPPEGGTNMEEALRLAGEKALEQRLEGAQNRIVLISDGAANLGDARPDALRAMVVGLRRQGIAFDACGVGTDGVNDAVLEAVTREGDGRYYLLNRPEDADEGFAKHLAGSLRPAARNVKVQVRFHPDRVSRYRLLGFEKHRLQKEDFRNDQVDAAELAGAETGVAVYQVEFAANGRGPLGEAAVRFQDAASGTMVERSWTIPYQERTPDLKDAAPAMQLAATAALVAEKLQGGGRGETVELAGLAPVLTNLRGAFPAYDRVEQLLQMAEVIRQRTE
ncbi:MAG TPA: von Willebrand factor type A domain-containing protein [Verrucomicrobiales bacterium]|nr:von Willebrand factor type A domain-containing protein [Verrucomicrobiales bacterium]